MEGSSCRLFGLMMRIAPCRLCVQQMAGWGEGGGGGVLLHLDFTLFS